ncbi:hypothetical protein GCM10027203_68110 [Nonomuraea fastidiosa]
MEQVRRWDRDHRNGPGPAFSVWPIDVPEEALPEGAVITKRHSRVSILAPEVSGRSIMYGGDTTAAAVSGWRMGDTVCAHPDDLPDQGSVQACTPWCHHSIRPSRGTECARHDGDVAIWTGHSAESGHRGGAIPFRSRPAPQRHERAPQPNAASVTGAHSRHSRSRSA